MSENKWQLKDLCECFLIFVIYPYLGKSGHKNHIYRQLERSKRNFNRYYAGHPSNIIRQLYSPKLCYFGVHKVWSRNKSIQIDCDVIHCSGCWLFMHNRVSWQTWQKDFDSCFCDWISNRPIDASGLYVFGGKRSWYTFIHLDTSRKFIVRHFH